MKNNSNKITEQNKLIGDLVKGIKQVIEGKTKPFK